MSGCAVEDAKAVLEASGYVVLKAASHRRALERQRHARAEAEWARRDMESSDHWARDCLAEERRLRDRLTFVGGIATAHGATVEELTA